MGNSSSSKGTINLSTRTAIQDIQKIVLLGAQEVGKTCLVVQHVENHFVAIYDSTIENSYRKTREVDGVPVTYEILDTCGAEEYTAMLDQYIRAGQGFIIVYSVNNRESFDSCTDIHKRILRTKDSDHVPVVLVGTKSDVANRVVPTAHGEELAKQLGIPFFETSAKNRINIDEVFDEITREIARSVAHVHAAPMKKK